MTEYRNPTPTVDVIINKNSRYPAEGKLILLISRKNAPLGWALPGGFVDEGESFEHAAVREAKEEVSLDVWLDELFYVYSNPNRDPRQHISTTVYIGHTVGAHDTPVAADDAQIAQYFTESQVKTMISKGEIVFDHARILMDFLKYSEGIPRDQIFNPMGDMVDVRS